MSDLRGGCAAGALQMWERCGLTAPLHEMPAYLCNVCGYIHTTAPPEQKQTLMNRVRHHSLGAW